MGYASIRPPGLGTYPSIEASRPLRWSAFEECGVRQVRRVLRWTGFVQWSKLSFRGRAPGLLLEKVPNDRLYQVFGGSV